MFLCVYVLLGLTKNPGYNLFTRGNKEIIENLTNLILLLWMDETYFDDKEHTNNPQTHKHTPIHAYIFKLVVLIFDIWCISFRL